MQYLPFLLYGIDVLFVCNKNEKIYIIVRYVDDRLARGAGAQWCWTLKPDSLSPFFISDPFGYFYHTTFHHFAFFSYFWRHQNGGGLYIYLSGEWPFALSSIKGNFKTNFLSIICHESTICN